jgi:hypothetical protein
MLNAYPSARDAFAALDASDADLDAVLDENPVGIADFVQGTRAFKPPLTEEEAKYVFKGLDADFDELVSINEFLAVVQLGHFLRAPDSHVHSQATVEASRITASSIITMADFKARMLRKYRSSWDAFTEMHANPADLEDFVKGAKSFEPPLSRAQAEFAFRGLDSDEDGQLVSFEFFTALQCDHFFPTQEELQKAAATTGAKDHHARRAISVLSRGRRGLEMLGAKLGIKLEMLAVSACILISAMVLSSVMCLLRNPASSCCVGLSSAVHPESSGEAGKGELKTRLTGRGQLELGRKSAKELEVESWSAADDQVLSERQPAPRGGGGWMRWLSSVFARASPRGDRGSRSTYVQVQQSEATREVKASSAPRRGAIRVGLQAAISTGPGSLPPVPPNGPPPTGPPSGAPAHQPEDSRDGRDGHAGWGPQLVSERPRQPRRLDGPLAIAPCRSPRQASARNLILNN